MPESAPDCLPGPVAGRIGDRTDRWRALTLPMALAWTVFAGFAAWESFDPVPVVFWGLMITSIYLLIAGAAQQAMYGKDG